MSIILWERSQQMFISETGGIIAVAANIWISKYLNSNFC